MYKHLSPNDLEQLYGGSRRFAASFEDPIICSFHLIDFHLKTTNHEYLQLGAVSICYGTLPG